MEREDESKKNMCPSLKSKYCNLFENGEAWIIEVTGEELAHITLA